MIRTICKFAALSTVIGSSLLLSGPTVAATLTGSFDWSITLEVNDKKKETKGQAIFFFDKHKQAGTFTLLFGVDLDGDGEKDKRTFDIASPVFNEETWKLKTFNLTKEDGATGMVDFTTAPGTFKLTLKDTGAPQTNLESIQIDKLKQNLCPCKDKKYGSSQRNNFLAELPVILFFFFEQPAYAQSCICPVPEPSSHLGTISALILGSSFYYIRKMRTHSKQVLTTSA
jgi:hypothetical protein